MKQVVKCAGCNKLTGLFGGRTFAVEINELVKTSEGKTVYVRTKARICKVCANDAGFAPRKARTVKEVVE